MMPLQLPQAMADEDKTLATLCKKPEWEKHCDTWSAAYNGYRAAHGDPWTITPAVFSTVADEANAIAELQQALYKSRSKSGPLSKIRKTPGLLCCPMCGSSYPGTLDHYLPKENFPEFSILPCNLVPACPHCNSGIKGDRFRGTVSPERFIHPYFDTIAAGPIWFVEIQPPFEAARFHPRVAAAVALADRPMVAFHLSYTLGAIFHDHASTQWSVLPRLVRGRIAPPGVIAVADVEKQLADDLRDAEVTSGRNGWRAALLRGIIANEAAIAFIANRAMVVVPVPD